MDNKEEVYMFTCKECGSHELKVVSQWEYVCGNLRERWEDYGYLDEIHHWEIEDEYLIDDLSEDWEGDWDEDEEEEEGWEVDPDSLEFWVRCGGCNREIEFGWSHPNRGGRIWPVECSDYIPGRSWPEHGIWKARKPKDKTDAQ